MKKKLTILVVTSVAIALVLSACGEGGSAGKLGLNPNSYGEAELSNGVHLLIHPATLAQSPLVSVAMSIPAGVDSEKSGEAGYSSLLARLLARTGEGAATTTLAAMGSALTIEVQADALLLTATVLREDAEAAYSAMANALNGEFATEEIMAERDRLVSELKASTSSTRDLLNATLYYGSPRAAGTDERSEALTAMSAEGFAAFARRALNPAGVTISVTGAVDNVLLNAVVYDTEKWAAAVESDAADEQEEAESEAGEDDYTPILVVDRPGNATGLFLLRRLPALNPEDYYRLEALNLILNGQSTYSRLTGVRVALQLPRPIESTLDLRANESSHIVSSTVPSERAAEVFAAAAQEVQRLYSGTILNSRLTEQEIADARNSLSGRLTRSTETSSGLARFLAWSARNGFAGYRPEDHLAMIESLNKAALLETVERYFDPRINALIAIGPAEELQTQFSEISEVKVVQ